MNLLILFFLLLILSSTNLWSCWVLMELMNFIFIPWSMWNDSSKSKLFLYFIFQTWVSSLFLISIFLSFNSDLFSNLMVLSIMMKLGNFPFHQWVIGLIEGISWKVLKLMLTLMKGVPIMIMYVMSMKLNLLYINMFGLMISIGGYSTNSIRILTALSSVNHSLWMIVIGLLSKWILSIYVLVYWLLMMVFSDWMHKLNMNSLKTVIHNSKLTKFFYILILMMSGLPPFSGFFIKLMGMKLMIIKKFFIETLVFSWFSVFPMYMYVKVFCFITVMEDKTFKPFMMKKYFLNMDTLKWAFMLFFPFISFIII